MFVTHFSIGLTEEEMAADIAFLCNVASRRMASEKVADADHVYEWMVSSFPTRVYVAYGISSRLNIKLEGGRRPRRRGPSIRTLLSEPYLLAENEHYPLTEGSESEGETSGSSDCSYKESVSEDAIHKDDDDFIDTAIDKKVDAIFKDTGILQFITWLCLFLPFIYSTSIHCLRSYSVNLRSVLADIPSTDETQQSSSSAVTGSSLKSTEQKVDEIFSAYKRVVEVKAVIEQTKMRNDHAGIQLDRQGKALIALSKLTKVTTLAQLGKLIGENRHEWQGEAKGEHDD